MGPLFAREAVTLPRRTQFYLFRAIYPTALAVMIATAWLMVTGTQRMLGVGDMARFTAITFQLLAILQLVIVMFASAILAASAVAQEKDRKTLSLLLMTRMNAAELVVGKLSAALLEVVAVTVAALPVFFLLMPLGGISIGQIVRTLFVTVAAAVWAGSVGVLVAYWREKTFQTLAMVVLLLCFWLGGWEVVAQAGADRSWLGIPLSSIASAFSPLRAIIQATSPFASTGVFTANPVLVYLFVTTVLILAMTGITMLRLRAWNTGDQLQGTGPAASADSGTWDSLTTSGGEEIAARGTPSARTIESGRQQTKEVWDNPVLWRECKTWAYGRKILFIRIAYIALAALIAFLVYRATDSSALQLARQSQSVLSPAAGPMAALVVVSWALLNALAVTSITTERDSRALDLLLATDLTPQEFVLGKMGGIASVAGLMILIPLLLSGMIWWREAISTQNWLYLIGALLTIDLFVAMLGIHCGIRYANSRGAIGVSMGTFFFLSLGVAACMMMMVSFSNSFHVQLVPFVAIILGGGVGLLAALGAGNPSAAMVVAALVVPFATFYVITCVLLRQELPAFLVTVSSYGFATAAMLIPAIFEFDFAMGRSEGRVSA